MKTFIKLVMASVLALSLAACQMGPTKTAADASSAIAAAVKANKVAKKHYVEWRDTGKLIKKARKAKAKGDFDKAVKLANKAKRQAQNAMAQYKEQKNAKPRL